MPPNSQLPTTSVLLIDGNDTERRYYANRLGLCSPNYLIAEAADGQSGLNHYRSRQVDCVVLELELPDRSGFEVLIDLVPIASKPKVAVIVLTKIGHRGLWEVAMQNGAYVCLVKRYTSGEDLDKAIQRAVAFVGWMPKEERHRHI